jgi:mRNA interferase RelE/StbE
MPVRVELSSDAVSDLGRYVTSGNIALFLAKLVRLEEVGKDAGVPLGGGLVGWRKIVVGDRDWRIIFTMNPDETVATVWVIGDRADAECYEQAARRVAQLGKDQPEAASLATVMLDLVRRRSSGKKRKKAH